MAGVGLLPGRQELARPAFYVPRMATDLARSRVAMALMLWRARSSDSGH